jgi:hypothetical protein
MVGRGGNDDDGVAGAPVGCHNVQNFGHKGAADFSLEEVFSLLAKIDRFVPPVSFYIGLILCVLGNQSRAGQQAEEHGGNETERKQCRTALMAKAPDHLHGLTVTSDERAVEIEDGCAALGCHWEFYGHSVYICQLA